MVCGNLAERANRAAPKRVAGNQVRLIMVRYAGVVLKLPFRAVFRHARDIAGPANPDNDSAGD
jgi:hypothetical protein